MNSHLSASPGYTFFHGVFSCFPLPVIVIDVSKQVFIEVNAAALDLLRYNRDTFLRSVPVQISEDFAQLSTLPGIAQSGASFTASYTCSDGSLFTAATRVCALSNDGNHYLVLTMQPNNDSMATAEESVGDDATDDKQQFQAKLLNTIGQAVIATDLAGNITFWNQAATNLYGWTEDEALGQNIIQITPSAQTRQQALQLMDQLRKGHTWSGEFLVQRKDGSKFPAYVSDAPVTDNTGKLTGIIGISSDISAQKRAEREMALLLDNTEEAFVLLNKNLELVTHNSQFSRLYQKYFNRQLQKGSSIFDYAIPDRIPELKKIYASVLGGNREITQLILSDPDGNARHFTLQYSPAKDEQKKDIIGVFVTVSDTTEQENAELARLAEQRNKEALINTTDDIIWSVDNHYKLVTGNVAFFTLIQTNTGITLRQGDNLMMKEKFSPEWLSYWKHLYDRALAGESFTQEVLTPSAPDVPERWDEIIFKPIVHEEQIVGIACHSRNISLRKQVEQQQQKTYLQQQLFSAIVQSSDDAIFSADLNGIVTSWNSGAQKMFGYSEAEAVGSPTSILFPPDRANERHRINGIINAKQFVKNLETKRLTKRGDPIDIALTISPILNPGGEVVGTSEIARDITGLKLNERAIKQSEQRYRTLFEQSLAGIYETTLEGEIINCNQAFASMLRYNTASELIHKNVEQIYFSNTKRRNFLADILLHQKIQNYEGVLQCKDGAALHFLESVTLQQEDEFSPPRINGIVLNITERILTETALQRSNELYYYVSKATSDVAWDWNLQTGKIARSAENMLKVFGYAPSSDIANADFWSSKIHPDDAEKIRLLFTKKFKDVNEQFMDSEYRFRRADGTYAYVYDKGFIIRNSSGEPIRMIGAVQDVSKLRESEMLLQKRAAELETSNKELEQFAYIASHDLQEPLRMVSSFLT